MTMTVELWAALAVSGWVVAVVMLGWWLGERRMRIWVQNQATFGGQPLKKAVVYDPPDAEDRLEEALDTAENIERIAGTKRTDPDQGIFWDQETLQNGVDWLLHQARENGEALTEAQARSEAELMLNAQGTEM